MSNTDNIKIDVSLLQYIHIEGQALVRQASLVAWDRGAYTHLEIALGVQWEVSPPGKG